MTDYILSLTNLRISVNMSVSKLLRHAQINTHLVVRSWNRYTINGVLSSVWMIKKYQVGFFPSLKVIQTKYWVTIFHCYYIKTRETFTTYDVMRIHIVGLLMLLLTRCLYIHQFYSIVNFWRIAVSFMLSFSVYVVFARPHNVASP